MDALTQTKFYVHWDMQESYSKLTRSMALKQIHWTSLRPFLHKGFGWSTGLANPVYIFIMSYITPSFPCALYKRLKLTVLWCKLVPRGTDHREPVLIQLRNRTRKLGLGSAPSSPHRVGSLTTTQGKGIAKPWRTMYWQHHAEHEGHFTPWQSLQQTPASEGSLVWSGSTCRFTMFSFLSSPQALGSFKLPSL